MAVKACAVAPALAIDGGGVDDEHLPWVEALVLLGSDVDPIEETCQAVRKPDTFALIAEAVSRTALGCCTSACDEDRFAIVMDQSFLFVREAWAVLGQSF